MKSKFKTFKYGFIKVYMPLLLMVILFILLYRVLNIHDEEVIDMIMADKTLYYLIFVELQKINIKYSLFICIFLFVWSLKFIRKENIDKFYNSNGNVYYNHKYFTFWFASKVMGYGKIQLSGIPLWMQSKLILKNTFSHIEPDMWATHYDETESKECIINVEEPMVKNLKCFDSLNLIIEDTYEIKKNQIGHEFANNPCLKIQSNYEPKGARVKNQLLVEKVKSSLDKYFGHNYNFKSIYIFTTANPINNLNITVSSLRRFDRLSNKKIYIVQMDENMIYRKKYKIVS